jgi:glycosyltransferase involved in cell wall biosynthesis
MKRVLILEPYYGGSHKYFLTGLQKSVAADYLLFTLPARKWKMRMQLSAPWFVEQIKALPIGDQYFDTVLCSTFVDVAVLRALLSRVEGWNNRAKILTYFHENQFAYPVRYKETAQHQFVSINFYSALASDRLAFNSEYNQESFLAGCRSIQKVAGDMKFPGMIKEISEKSRILYPGVEFGDIDNIQWKRSTDIPVIVWNHRWEHDKNPQSFFRALNIIKSRGIDFRLIILGQSFATSPGCFARAKRQFKDEIIHYGYVPSYQEYIELLGKGDIVVSTAHHEFYGISVIEAVRAGCLPVLPNRLSYPELFDDQYMYNDDSLAESLAGAIKNSCRLTREAACAMTKRFSWESQHQSYAQWL